MQLRRFEPADAPALAAILLPVIREGETYALDRDMDAAAAVAYWTAPENMAIIAHCGDDVIGSYYLRANQRGGGAHVANCGYVTAPEARGRGVARAMAEHSFEQARAAGFRAMQFNFVVTSNAPAVHLWRALGFAIVGRLPGAFEHPALGPVDALVMHRAL